MHAKSARIKGEAGCAVSDHEYVHRQSRRRPEVSAAAEGECQNVPQPERAVGLARVQCEVAAFGQACTHRLLSKTPGGVARDVATGQRTQYTVPSGQA